jgi:NADH:ubiquinone oxidoreductase subunit
MVSLMFLSKLKLILKRSFTWWNGQTLGTWLFTYRFGIYLGTDDFGNRYYCNHDKTRRWVIYPHYSEASSVPPEWHAWLHRITDLPPSQTALNEKPWEEKHIQNLTGTPHAYTPFSSLSNTNIKDRRKASGDYEAWLP